MKLLPVLLAVFLIMVAGLVYILTFQNSRQDEEGASYLFTVMEMGRAGGDGYAIFSQGSNSRVALLTLDKKPERKITIINDSEGMEMERLPELVTLVSGLEEYGFKVSVSSDHSLGEGIFLVPTGAMPDYAYTDLLQNSSEATVLFIGQKNLVIDDGIKKEDWYSSLPEGQRKRIVIYETTLDELMKNQSSQLFSDILENTWNVNGERRSSYEGSGIKTITAPMEDGEFIRLIYEYSGGKKVVDSAVLPSAGRPLEMDSKSIYPWERSTLSFDLNKTNGTAYLSVMHNGEQVRQQELRRVTDSNYFLERFQFDEPGEYIIRVSDNTGVIASTILHVKDLRIIELGSSGVNYIFNVTVDGIPVDNEKAIVGLANSGVIREEYVDEGILSVGISSSALHEGENILDVNMYGTTMLVTFRYTGSSIIQFYVTYGIPGLVIVILVYFIASISRRPRYMIRFSDLATEIRKDAILSYPDALNAIKRIRGEMQLGTAPITSREFSIALKRFVTDGAEITGGNVDEILNRLCNSGHIETHLGYYQPKGEGDVRRNTLLRMIRERLIENGVSFSTVRDKFVTTDYEIGFFGDNFKKKAILVIDSEQEKQRILSSLSEKEKAMLRIKQSNGVINFVPISKLGEYL